MKREVYTFSPGPCIFPLEVLEETKAQISCPNKSILEYKHDSARVKELIQDCKSHFRKILSIPDSFSIFFSSGGATSQFASIPFHMLENKESVASYIVNGTWSTLAFEEAKMFGKPELANPLQTKKEWTYAPTLKKEHLNSKSKYLYYCDNETVHGIEFSSPPESFGLPLITDMTSNFLTKPVDFNKFAIVYSGAQKNWGPAGLAVVIIRNDLIDKNGLLQTPKLMKYYDLLKNEESSSHLPVFALFVARNSLKWILANGGVNKMNELCLQKAKIIYDTIDNSNGFYVNHIQKDSRSRVNLVCTIRGNEKSTYKLFGKEAEKNGILQVLGHPSVGGLRFSIYNGMPMDGVLRLQKFMIEFQKSNQNRQKL